MATNAPIASANPTTINAPHDTRNHAGFDAATSHQLTVVPPPDDRLESAAHQARGLLDRLVLVPVYPEMPDEEIDRLGEVLLDIAGNGRASAILGSNAGGL